jgi:homopolymeric O-antigen transport system ATP-binding protein
MVISGLGKRYRLGAAAQAFTYGSLRDTIARTWSRAQPPPPAEHIWALQDVSFEVGAGEVVGIVGANGAGKSTLLKILSRITWPTTGSVDLWGRVGSLLEVGTGFHPELTGRDNVFLNGAILGMRRDEIARRFDAIVDFSGIERFLDTPVKRYSSGMYVRLAFAVAAHLEPDILIVDEVLAVGDAEFQRKCLGKMESVVREGRTVLFVSHNMAAVKALCSRAILLRAGRVVCDGKVDDVVETYLQSGRAAAENTIVPDDAARSGTGEARIRRVSLVDRGDRPLRDVHLGQPFRVLLGLDVARPVEGLLAGVSISTLEGTPVASSFSTDGGKQPWTLGAGRHSIVVDLDTTLLPRKYSLDVFVTRLDGREIDFVTRVIDFDALPFAQTGTDTYPWVTVRGFVRPPASWQVYREGAVWN